MANTLPVTSATVANSVSIVQDDDCLNDTSEFCFLFFINTLFK